MKKIYLLILCVLTLFTSCEKEDTIPDQKLERDLETVNIQETLNLLPSTSVKTKGW